MQDKNDENNNNDKLKKIQLHLDKTITKKNKSSISINKKYKPSSSFSKNTAGFDDSFNFLNNVSTNKRSQGSRISGNMHFQRKSKDECSNIYANISISILNPNISVTNNNNNSGFRLSNSVSKGGLNNNTLITFHGSKEGSEITSPKIEDNRVLSSFCADLENEQSNSDSIDDNCKSKELQYFNDYINKKKIVQFEFKSCFISGFSAYSFRNKDSNSVNKIGININLPKENDKILNYFSIFSGEDKDSEICSYLRTNLGSMILSEENIITNPLEAIRNGFLKAEINFIEEYLKNANKKNNENKDDISLMQNDYPKASAIVLLNINDIFYIANLSDSLTIISSDYSKFINTLSTQNSYYSDEFSNILRFFPGKKYHNIMCKKNNNNYLANKYVSGGRRNSHYFLFNNYLDQMNSFIQNPRPNESCFKKGKSNNRRKSLGIVFQEKNKFYEDFPDFSDNIDDFQINKFNNNLNKNVFVSSFPDVIAFKLRQNHDFIIIACDSILQKLTQIQIIKCVYETMKKCIKKHRSFEKFLNCVVKDIIKACIISELQQNIACIFICFPQIKQLYLSRNIDIINSLIFSLSISPSLNNRDNFPLYNDLLIKDLFSIEKAVAYNRVVDKYYNRKRISFGTEIIKISENEDSMKNYIPLSKNKLNDCCRKCFSKWKCEIF